MKLATLLKFQFMFFLMAIGYLIMSYVSISKGEAPLSPADPLISGSFLLLYGLFLVTAMFKMDLLYRILMAISVLGFGYGGVIFNILNYIQNGIEGYSSFMAWFIAVAINSYGLVFNLLAMMGKYKQ